MNPIVQFVDLRQQQQDLQVELTSAMADVVRRGDFILGRDVADFEKQFAEYCGAQFAIGVASGLDALTLSLQALEIGPGDEVITQANSFIATAYSIERTGARPILVDVRSDTAGIDVEQIAAAVTPRTRAIVPVHLYGLLAEMDQIQAVAERHDLVVIEDAAQAHGARLRSGTEGVRGAGNLGRAAAFSFYPAKNLGALGDGGAVTTNNADIAARVRQCRNYGQRERYHHVTRLGTNSRLDTLQAAVLLCKLQCLDDWNDRRRAAARMYHERLQGTAVRLPYAPSDPEKHVWHLFVIQLPEPTRRDEIRRALQSAGIETGVHYPIPIHRQAGFEHLGYAEGQFPISERASTRVLSLPMHPHLTEADIEHVVTQLIRSL